MVKKYDPGVGHLPIQWVLHVGHLNSFLELGDGGDGGVGMLRLQIDRCLIPYKPLYDTLLPGFLC